MAREASDGSKAYLEVTSYGTGTVNGGSLSAKLQNCKINGSYILVENKVTISQIKTLLSNAVTNDSTIKTGTIVTNGSDKYTAIKLGDVSKDGEIKSADYILIRNYIMGKKTFSAIEGKAADVNQDGKIMSADYILIRNHIMEKSFITI